MLQRFGEVRAVRPTPESRAYACERSSVVVEGGLLPTACPDLSGPFDLVAAFDVVEHVAEDAAAVSAWATS